MLIAIAYPFVALYEVIGGTGYLVLIAGALGGWFYLSRRKKARSTAAFEADAALALGRSLDPETARAMNRRHATSNARRASLLRSIQIFTDSVAIALSSKKADTATHRLRLASETYEKISKDRTILGPRLCHELDAKYQHLLATFASALTLNVARDHIEKASALKTAKARMDRLQRALAVLEEGIAGGAGASPEVHALADEVRARVGGRT